MAERHRASSLLGPGPSLDLQAPLLSQIEAQHGPLSLVGRLLLRAEQEARARDVRLTLEPIEAFAAFMRAEMPQAPPLPHFRPEPDAFTHSRALCLLGRDPTGRIVATQAVRVYDWSGSTLKAEAESLRMFYGQSAPQVGAACRATAPSADRISGVVAYSGGGWYAPGYRGIGLSLILPRISRMLALTLWNSQTTISFVEWPLVEKGVVQRYGYINVENGIEIDGMIEAPFKAALVWMDLDYLLNDAESFLEKTRADSGRIDQQRSARKIASST